MDRKQLPRFVLYQPEAQEYHLCFEAKGKLYCWRSLYPPSMDIRYPRSVKKIQPCTADKYRGKHILDEGFYYITQKDDRQTAEQKFLNGIKEHTFSLFLKGKSLRGRFSLKETDAGPVLQKLKDKYAVEEDILSGDLSRTVQNMIPDFNPADFQLSGRRKRKQEKGKPGRTIVEETVTADKKIGQKSYHFEFYHSDTGNVICLVSGPEGDVLILQLQKSDWKLLTAMRRPASKLSEIIRQHARLLLAQLSQ